MPAIVRFLDFSEQLVRGTHSFPTHVLKVVLTNTLPSVADTNLSQIVQLPATGGNVVGGVAVSAAVSRALAVTTLTLTEAVFTATAGGVGPFRYYVLYNDTAATKPVIGFVDHGSAVLLPPGASFTVRFSNASPGAAFTTTAV